jgi:hypothetical protein
MNRNSRKTSNGAVISHSRNFEVPGYGLQRIRYRISQPTSKQGSDMINDAVKKLNSIIKLSKFKRSLEPPVTIPKLINRSNCRRLDSSQV